MISKAQKHMGKVLKTISKIYNVPVFEEVKEGNKRYDFYFPTNPPLVFEIDGKQHEQNEADGFFFKSTKSLINYKLNDLERDNFDKIGKIILFRYSDKEFPNFTEVLEDLEKRDAIKILDKGIDEENAYYTNYIFNQEKDRRRKEQNREFRKKLKEKQRNNTWNRSE